MLLRSIIQYRCNVFVSEARIALEIKTIATNYYRISFLRLFPNLLASLWWFCHLLNLANMKSQPNLHISLPDFRFLHRRRRL